MLYRHEILSSVWHITDAYASNYLPLVTSYLKGEVNHSASTSETSKFDIQLAIPDPQNGIYQIDKWAEYRTPEQAPEGSIAILNIQGAITKHDQFCGPVGMVRLTNLMERCYINPNIEGITLKIESGGGLGTAMRLMAETISKRNKQVIAYVEDLACSAAYGIASGCDCIVANSDLSILGSIGTYMSIADYSKKLEKEGIAIKDLYATDSRDKNSMIREFLNGNPKLLQDFVDTFNNYFLALVESNRGDALKSTRKEWGTGKEFFAGEALNLGLIDAIDSFDNILNYFKS